MADNFSISGPVSVQSDSKERVAFDLMVRISNNENGNKNRRYFLELYTQCHQAVRGSAIEHISPEP